MFTVTPGAPATGGGAETLTGGGATTGGGGGATTIGGAAMDVKATMAKVPVAQVSLFLVVIFMPSIELRTCRERSGRF